MAPYDFIMAGGGLAGLSLAHQLVSGPFPEARVLVLDVAAKGENDRTWCYWAREPVPFDVASSHRWRRLAFRSRSFSGTFDITPYEYRMVRGIDFYHHVLSDLEQRPTVEFRTERVIAIRNPEQESGPPAVVETESGSYEGLWVFDSRFHPEEYGKRGAATGGVFGGGTRPYHYLMQHFLGWEVETSDRSFDPGTVTLFDFRTPQKGEMRFMYVLPFSPTRALVEFTLFSASLLPDQEYSAALEAYLRDVLGLTEYRVAGRETGVIPMTDQPFPRRTGSRTLATGTRGGRVKASTGYAFRRVQRDVVAIVESLARHGHPFAIPASPAGFATLDTMLLQIMYRRGGLSELVFTRLFSRNPVQRLLRFLDEETSPAETVAIMATVPWGPFIRAWIRTKLLRKV